MEKNNRPKTSIATIILVALIAIIFLAAVIWVATLEPGQMVLVMLVILFIYFGWRFLFG